MEHTRRTLLESFETILDTISDGNRKTMENQVSMFDISENTNINEIKYNYTIREEFSEKELLSMEKEMIGFYISGHPLEKYREQIEKTSNINSIQLSGEDLEQGMELKDGQFVKYIGIVTSIKKKYTKNNTIMAFVTIEDLYGTAEIIVFDSVYSKASNILIEDSIVLVEGRISIREDEASTIVARDIKLFNTESTTKPEINNQRKKLIINIVNLDDETRNRLKGAIKFFSGDRANILLNIEDNEGIKPCAGIFITDKILNEFKEIVGNENVTIE